VQLHTDDWTEELQQGDTLSALCARLELLPDLSALQLDIPPEKKGYWTPTGPDLTSISTIQSLQELHITVRSHSQAAAVAAVLPIGLTSLHVGASYAHVRPQLRAVPEVCLTRLTNLQGFLAEGVCMRLSSLASLTWLQELLTNLQGFLAEGVCLQQLGQSDVAARAASLHCAMQSRWLQVDHP
jgi:hypothetical protein